MSESAALRAQRLLDLVPYLQSHPGISIAEVAVEFGVSKSELLKDLNLLFLCGLPGYTHLELIDIAFDDDFIDVIDAQNLASPRRLTESESLALRIALSALYDSLPLAHHSRQQILHLLTKISAMFSSDLPDNLISFSAPRARVVLATLEKAITDQRKLSIVYLNRSKDEKRVRKISPIKINIDGERSALMAWCHENHGMRTFTINQIEDALILDEESTPGGSHLEGADDSGETQVAKIRILSQEGTFLRENKNALENLTGDSATLRYFNPEWLIRNALAFSDEIAIIEPPHICAEIAKRANGALSNYR
jgi:proteasome accessory factor C